jgi:predicted DNA-binding protein (MmcQ/YjbR family)
MNIESFRQFCLKKPGVTEHFPFDESTLVFKVMGKMFALTDIYQVPMTINLKCDPEKALELREQYEAVIPGWHMDKKHWNTVIIDHTIADKVIQGWVDDSYDLVVQGLSKKARATLGIGK